MKVYRLESNSIFIRCADGVKIHAFKLGAEFSSSSIIKLTDWKYQASIGPELEYEAVEIFGVVINEVELKNLAEQLCHYHLIVNREGYCFLNTEAIVNPSFGVPYYRLNDMFCWSNYGIKPNITSIWNRCSIISSGEILINFEERFKSHQNFHREVEQSKAQIASLKLQLGENQTRKYSVTPLPPPPPIRFYVSESPLANQFNVNWILRKFSVVDEDLTGLFPRNVSVYVKNGEFDCENWRFMRAEENERIYMLGYYTGEYAQVQFHKNFVNVPYNSGLLLLSDVYFFVALISGIGFKFAFLY